MGELADQDLANVAARERYREHQALTADMSAVVAGRWWRMLVSPERIELSADGLKVHCSTTELRACEVVFMASGRSGRAATVQM